MSDIIAPDAINDERDTEIARLTAELADAEKRATGAGYLRFLSMSDEMGKLEKENAALREVVETTPRGISSGNIIVELRSVIAELYDQITAIDAREE